jgi:plastocyanin
MRIRPFLLLATLLSACGGGGDSTGPVTVASVSITPGTDIATFTPGSKIDLKAAAVDATGGTVASATPTWTTTDATIISLSFASGTSTTVTGLAIGSAKVIATAGGKADTISVTIVAQVFSSVKMNPLSTSISPSSTTTVTAQAVDQNGVGMSGAGFGAATFTSSNTAVATVNSTTGLVTAIANGSATITGSIAANGVTKSGLSVVTVATGGGFPNSAVVAADGTYGWDPSQVDIAVGGTVTFQNQTTYTHNVTFSSASGAPQNIGDFIGDSRGATFPTAGTFSYHCTIHPGMTGTVVVH